jgi:hypothetical protein
MFENWQLILNRYFFDSNFYVLYPELTNMDKLFKKFPHYHMLIVREI